MHTNVLQPEVSVSASQNRAISVNDFITVAGWLLQSPHNRAIHGLYAGDAPRQHPPESSSRHSDRHKVLRRIRAREADRNV